MPTKVIRGKRYTHYQSRGLSFGHTTADHIANELRGKGYHAVIAKVGREWGVFYRKSK